MVIRVVAGFEQPIRTRCSSNDDTDGSLSTSGCGLTGGSWRSMTARPIDERLGED